MRVGLKNFANSCHFNTALQCMYTPLKMSDSLKGMKTNALRDLFYKWDNGKSNNDIELLGLYNFIDRSKYSNN